MMPFSPKPLINLQTRPHGLSKEHTIALGGVTFVPDLSGALLLRDEATLLVSDLHLEHGVSMARRGVHVPPFDTFATLAQLEQVLNATQAKRLILLGDSFHDAVAHDEIDDDVRTRLCAITSRIDTVWISGNHDPAAPRNLGGTAADCVVIGRIMLRHIPGDIEDGTHEIAGHLHPGARIVQRGRSVHGKCFIADQRRMIMPAFGAYTGGLTISSRAFDGLFDEATARIWMIGRASLHGFAMRKVR
jgi:uncharacterized protein